jgi:hypothetical protein
MMAEVSQARQFEGCGQDARQACDKLREKALAAPPT